MADGIDYFGGMDQNFTNGLASQGITNDIYGNLTPEAKLNLSQSYTDNPQAFDTGSNLKNSFGQTGIMDSISGMLPTLGGLAQLYMQWDQLQAKKDSARDAHNATATQYNNQVSRAKNLGKSVFGNDYQSSQQNIAKSTV